MIKWSAILACILIFVSACQETGNNKTGSSSTVDTCITMLHDFDYPGALNADSVPHLCLNRVATGRHSNFKNLFTENGGQQETPGNDKWSFFAATEGKERVTISYTRPGNNDTATGKKELLKFSLISRFYDNAYALFRYGASTKILYDSRNDIILCFKKEADYPDFNKASVFKIYLLNDQLMPLFSINRIEDNMVACHRYYYDARHPELYSELFDISKLGSKQFYKLKYSELISIFKSLESGKMPLTGKYETHLSSYFKTVPLWTEG